MTIEYEIRNKEIYRLHGEENWTCQKIADEYDISRQRIYQILQQLGYYRAGIRSIDKRKQEVYEYIIEYKRAHDGCSPSGREIRDGCTKVGSWGQANALLRQLIKEDKLKKSNNNVRTIEVVGGMWIAPISPYK